MSALITCGHTRQSLSATRSLGRSLMPVAVGAVKKPFLSMWSRYASSNFITPDPQVEPHKFAKVIAQELIGRYSPCALVATDDAWWALSKFRDELPTSAQKIFPPHISVVRALDHEALQNFAQSLFIPTAPIIRFKPESSFDEVRAKIKKLKFPLLIRPIVSWTNREDGQERLNQKLIAQDKAHLFSILKNYNYFLQYGFLLCTHQPKKSVAFFGVADQGKALAYGFLERKSATFAQTITPKLKIKEYSSTLLSALNWQGPFKIEFILDDKRSYRLVSITGRLWSSLELAIKAGLNVPLISYQLAEGQIDKSLLKNAHADVPLSWLDVFDIKDPLPFLFEAREKILMSKPN